MKSEKVKFKGKNGNDIILSFKPEKDLEAEDRIMKSLIEIYEYRINVNNEPMIVNC